MPLFGVLLINVSDSGNPCGSSRPRLCAVFGTMDGAAAESPVPASKIDEDAAPTGKCLMRGRERARGNGSKTP